VTAAGVDRPRPGTVPGHKLRSAGPRRAGVRLGRLHAASRRVLPCLLVLVACAVALRTALHWLPRTGVYSRQIPLTIEAAAAAVIGVTTRSPFGEAERATGRWLPFLRLGTCLALAGGTVGMLRDLAGFTGIALLTAVLLGGALSWAGPIAYLGVTVPALSSGWTTPWVWPARPPHDHGAAICAAMVFGAGLALISLRGARDSTRE